MPYSVPIDPVSLGCFDVKPLGAHRETGGLTAQMSVSNEFERRRRASQEFDRCAAIRVTVREVHALATSSGMHDPGELEDFVVGALRLEWPRLGDSAARYLTRKFIPR